MATVCIRVDDTVKKQAAEIAQYYGFDLSSVTRAFWKQMIRENRIPLTLDCYEPNEESLESIREIDNMIASKTARFDNVQETLASLKA